MRIAPRRSPGALASISILLTALWSAAGAIDSFDVQARLRVAEQLVREHRLEVGARPDSMNFSMFRDRAGLYPSYFGFGQSLFFVPFVAVSDGVASLPGLSPPVARRLSRFITATAVYAVMLLLTYWLCLGVARALQADQFAAHIAAFVAVFGSSFWQMAKQQQEEVQLAGLALLGLYGYLRWRCTGRERHVWLSGATAAVAIAFRPPALTFSLGLFALFAIEGIRRGMNAGRAAWEPARAFLATGIVAAGLIMAYNRFKTGNLFEPGYADAQFSFLPSNAGRGLVGQTVGLDRGLIWHNLWLVPLGLTTLWRWRSLPVSLQQAAGFAGYLLLASVGIYCSWVTWAGDMTFGTRFQQHAVPLLAAVLVVGAFASYQPATLGARRLISLAALLLAAAQLPSLVFVHNLEILQSMVEGRPHTLGHTNTEHDGGQLRLRFANVRSKLADGATVPLDTLDRSALPMVLGVHDGSGDSAEQQAAALTLLRKLSRWDFWPWRIEDYVPARGVVIARGIWATLVAVSIALWAWLFLSLAAGNRPLDASAVAG
jgi:hypothetical protein